MSRGQSESLLAIYHLNLIRFANGVSAVSNHTFSAAFTSCRRLISWIQYYLPSREVLFKEEDLFVADVHEGLLVDDQGRVLEGLTSNFFAVKQTEEGHIVETSAAEGEEPLILDGVMRRLVLLACTFVSIDVELVSPSIASAAEWSEAFTTNRCLPHTCHTHAVHCTL